MKKVGLILSFCLLSIISYSQWTFQMVSNDFDDPYPIAYTSVNNGSVLKLENVDEYLYFYLQGGYFCDEYPIVDLVFVVNGQNVKYSVEGYKNEQSNCIFFTTDLMNEEMLNSFKLCSVLKVRINESHCESNIYSFNMSKSTSALNFMRTH